MIIKIKKMYVCIILFFYSKNAGENYNNKNYSCSNVKIHYNVFSLARYLHTILKNQKIKAKKRPSKTGMLKLLLIYLLTAIDAKKT